MFKNKNKMKKELVLAALAVAAVGCTNDSDNFKENNPAEAGYISFGNVVNVETRAGAVLGKVIPSGDAIGIYALAADGVSPSWVVPTAGESANPLLNNQQGTSDGSGAISYNPMKVYAGIDSTYSFFAYYPYKAKATGVGDGLIDPGADKAPTLKVTLAATPEKQDDYMYATPITNFAYTFVKGKTTDPQNLVFKHAMTQIRFKFKNTEATDSVGLRSITVVGLNKGTMNITDGSWAISPKTTAAASTRFTVYSPSAPTIVSNQLASTAPGYEENMNVLSIQTGTGDKKQDIRLMLFPLSANEIKDNGADSKELLLSFEIMVDEYKNGAFVGVSKKAIVKPNVPAGGLAAGSSYLYTLLYSKEAKDFITFTAEVTEWVDATGGDLPTTPE